MNNNKNFRPRDTYFNTEDAMYFVDIKTREIFDAWVKKYRVRRVRRPKSLIYFRCDLNKAMEAEMEENGERA